MGYKLNGKGLPLDAPFTDSEGTKYPANWLRLASDSDKAAVPTGGITYETIVEVSFDPRYYRDKDTARPLADVKREQIADQKRLAGTFLKDSDWLAIRAAEGGTDVPTAWATYRAGVRTKSKEREDLITACSDVPAVRLLVSKPEGTSGALPVWPTKP
tara:strand:+ start:1862 stop:2335 length:474 start_codon:yes stop_codon:yes gene_type:complete